MKLLHTQKNNGRKLAILLSSTYLLFSITACYSTHAIAKGVSENVEEHSGKNIGKKLSGLAHLNNNGNSNKNSNGKNILAVASKKTGITLTTIHTEKNTVNTHIRSRSPGEFELLDSKQSSQRQWLITADAHTGQAHLFSAPVINNDIPSNNDTLSNNNTPTNKYISIHSDLLSSSTALRNTSFQPNAFCLYVDKKNNLFAFMLDGYGGGEMRWLWDARKDALVDITVKSLSLPPGSESCAVDDASSTLLVTEEDFGVWQYPAEPEGAWQRHLVAAVKPWGTLTASPVGVSSIAPYHFALFSEHNAAVYRITNNGKPAKKMATPKIHATEIMDVTWLDDQLIVLDEGRDTLLTAPLTAKQIEKSIAKAHHDFSDLPAEYPTVVAKAQTPPMQRRGDAADDPAIWVHPTNPEKSLVLGTHKKWGLFVYNLQGNQAQSIATGHINNIDVRQGVHLNKNTKAQDIAIASNRTDNTLTIYTINPNNGYVSQAASIATGLHNVYGVCLYTANTNAVYAFINDKDGRFQQYQLIENTPNINTDKNITANVSSNIAAKLVREFQVNSQPEACVANDATGELFIGEEDVGVWLFNADPTASQTGRLIATVGDVLVDDVEGLALVNNSLGHYLIVSSQGDNSYAVYKATAPYNYVGSFRVGLNNEHTIDGTSETDGIAINGAALSKQYPHGLLVIQDGFNLMPSQPQNFKYVSWEDVIGVLNKSR